MRIDDHIKKILDEAAGDTTKAEQKPEKIEPNADQKHDGTHGADKNRSQDKEGKELDAHGEKTGEQAAKAADDVNKGKRGDHNENPETEITEEKSYMQSNGTFGARDSAKMYASKSAADKAAEKYKNSKVEKDTSGEFVVILEQKSNEDCDDDDDDDVDFVKEMKESDTEFKLSDELGRVLESEELSEETSGKIKEIFETAVNHASRKHVKAVKDDFAQMHENAIEKVTEQMRDHIDGYVTRATKHWMNEHQLEIERGIRLENAESFMSGLADLLREHHVDVPEDKMDLYQESVRQNEELESKLDEQVQRTVQLENDLLSMHKKICVESMTEGMTETEAEALRELAEDVQDNQLLESFDQESYMGKIQRLKENYFGESTESNGRTRSDQLARDMVTEDVNGSPASQEKIDEEQSEGDPMMKRFEQSLSRFGGGR